MSKPDELELLLVEDNLRDAELAIRELQKHHLINHLVHLRDGEQALEFLFATGVHAGRDINDHPKVVLLDLKLPKVDGLEVLEKLRGDERTRGIPVVVLTSSREQGDLVKSYDLGVNSFIVKPVSFNNFSSAVAELGCYWLLLNTPPA